MPPRWPLDSTRFPCGTAVRCNGWFDGNAHSLLRILFPGPPTPGLRQRRDRCTKLHGTPLHPTTENALFKFRTPVRFGGPSNALPFRCKGRYVMVDSTTARAGPMNVDLELTGPCHLQRHVRRQDDLSTPIPLPDPPPDRAFSTLISRLHPRCPPPHTRRQPRSNPQEGTSSACEAGRRPSPIADLAIRRSTHSGSVPRPAAVARRTPCRSAAWAVR